MSQTFKYTISRKHCFVDNEPVLMYYVENMPFAFDVLEREEKEDKWILSEAALNQEYTLCLLYTSPSPRDRQKSRMPSSA